jgi:Uri superfamily endonuclease
LKGIYVLIIQLSKNTSVAVGALGKLTFDGGLYAYVGSAQNNLELRVQRHKRKNKRLFWHIDYLLNDKAATITEVLYAHGDKTKECQIARKLEEKSEPIKGFGCSDCHCKSHLFHAESFQFLKDYMQPLKVMES